MKNENNLDAKEPTNAASSSADANSPAAAPSSAPDANKVESRDFAELAIEALHKQHPETKPSEPSTEALDPEQPAAPGAINKSNTTEDETAKAESSEALPKDKADADESLPFHKHERFQELKRERDEFKTAAETAKPSIERLSVIDQFCTANRITPDQFKTAMEIQALVNSSPEKALERLEPLLTHLQAFKGQILSEDLKSEVDAGTLPLARAQEIAKLRKQSQFKEQQSAVQSNEQRAERLMTALSSWEANVSSRDADYAGKKQLITDRFIALSANNPWQTPDQAVALAKRAYDEVNASLSRFVPKPRPTKNPPVNGHSSAAKPAFTSWSQAEDMALDFVRGKRR